jgi:glyoxylase-like metal-dependent hydrolase (beta-lactamase superfamily II)
VSQLPAGIVVSGTLQRQAWLDRVLPPVERVRPGLWSIPTPFPGSPLRYVLSYAVEYDHGVALIDTGWPCDQAWDGLVAGLGQAGWDIGDVRAVLVTHGHGDHKGLAKRIRERSGAWVAMHEADVVDAAAFDSQLSFRQASDEWLRRRGGLAADFSAVRDRDEVAPDSFDEFILTPDRLLVDGERPLGPGTSLTSVWTPGHTPGHVCFVDRERGVMMTGDHILPRITPNISPSPYETGDTLGQYLASLAATPALPGGEVLPAHEYRFVGLAERALGLRKHHEQRLAEVMAALRATPGTTSVQVTEALKWSRPWEQMQGLQRRFAIGEAYAHLVHLERTGFVSNKGTDVDAWHPLRDGGPRLD